KRGISLRSLKCYRGRTRREERTTRTKCGRRLSSRNRQNVANGAQKNSTAEWFGQYDRRCIALGGFACGMLAVTGHINYANAVAQLAHLSRQLLPADSRHDHVRDQQ